MVTNVPVVPFVGSATAKSAPVDVHTIAPIAASTNGMVEKPAATNPAVVKTATVAAFYNEWKLDDFILYMQDLGGGHDFQRGKQVFERSLCGTCHAFAGFSHGTGLAPDLTSVGNQFTREFILQSLLEPSAVINGQYYFTEFHLKDGEVVSGKLIDVVDRKVRVAPAVAAPENLVEIREDEIVSRNPSALSPMPAGLLNNCTGEEILDLIAFLVSAGNPQAAVFAK